MKWRRWLSWESWLLVASITGLLLLACIARWLGR